MRFKTWYNTLITLLFGFLFVSVAEHYYGVAMEGDVGCFQAISHQMKIGQRLYTDVYDNKAPGIFYLNYLIPNLGFKTITSSWIIHMVSFALFLATFGKLYNQWTKVNVAFGIGAAIFVVFALRTIVFFWPAFFVGGYTEEIGSYFFIAGFLLLYQSSNQWIDYPEIKPQIRRLKLLLSGLLLGTAVLIKEPFVFFIPVAMIWLLFVKRNEIIFLILGFVGPWLIHFILLLKNDSIWNYFHYLKFALNYGNANKSFVNAEKLKEVIQPIQFDSLPVVNVIQLFVFSGFIILLAYQWFLKNRVKNKLDVKPNLSQVFILFITYLLFLVGSKVFGLLGKGAYLHYQIPEYLFSWLGLVLFLHAIYLHLLCVNQPHKLYHVAIVIATMAILVVSNSLVKFKMPTGHTTMFQTLKDPHFINGSKYPKLVKLMDEEMAWNNFLFKQNIQLPKHIEIFIDDPHLGRFYGYLNSQYRTCFPCPYWIYFHSDDSTLTNKIWPFLEQNRSKIIRQLQERPPQFVLTGENKGPFGTFTDLILFFNQNFRKRGEFYLGEKKLELFERISPDKLYH